MRALTDVAHPGAPSQGGRSPVPDVVLFHGVAPAGRRRTWTLAVDALAIVGLPIVLALGLVRDGVDASAAVASAVALACAITALGLVDLARHGRTLGHRVLDLRTVARADGLPGGAPTLLSGRGVTADLTLGRDPLRIVPAALAPMPEDVDPWIVSTASVHRDALVLVSDDGSVLPVVGSTVIGRSPVDATGTHRLLSVPDLSRSISRSHALLEPVDSALRVTDLGSANGTRLAPAGESFTFLVPGVPVLASAGARLALGERTMLIADPRGEGR